MTTRIMRRLLSIVLSVVMVVSLLPVTAIPVAAAELALPEGLGLSAVVADTGTWSVTSESPLAIKGYVAGTGSCTGSGSSVETTMTLTNTSGAPKVLNFDYTIKLENNGQFLIDGVHEFTDTDGQKGTSNSSGHIKRNLAAGDTITLKLISAAGSESKETLNLSNITITDPPPSNVTFLAPVGGTVTADGSGVTEDTTIGKNTISVTASPASGYEFLAWMDAETNERLSATANTSITFDKDTKVSAIFVPTTNAKAWFLVAKTYMFDDLKNACDYAAGVSDKTIVLMNNGVLTGSYTIPAGITLLVPYSNANVLRGVAAEYTLEGYSLTGSDFPPTPEPSVIRANDHGANPRKEFRRLTMAENAVLTVNGALEVSGQTHSLGKGQWGGYGLIQMGSGSKIIINSGANLYCWGYIRGSGTVEAMSGSTTYEPFDIYDYPPGGGGTMSDMNDQNVLAFKEYTVHGVEAPMTVHSGATCKIYMLVSGYMIGYNSKYLTYVGTDSNAIIQLTSGTLERDWVNDRQQMVIAGNAVLNATQISLAGSFNYNVDMAKTGLCIPSVWDVTIKSGYTVTTKLDLPLLAGSTVTVEQGANFVISEGKSVYLFDAATDPSGVTTDALLNVNGTITVNGGLYTTENARVTTSQGTGIIDTNNVGTKETVKLKSGDATMADYALTPAKLLNSDSTYVEANTAPNLYAYADGFWAPCNHEGYVVTDAAKAPTCIETGLTEGSHCSRCDAIIVAQTTVDALGHTDADGDGNHTCDRDGCSEVVGECADPDKDHACNECGGKVGEHADTNNDHNCEYGCSEKIGEHADTNNDHNCEYGCSEKIGEHADTNNDHNCEYGCAEKIGTCEDADKDHKCDYGCDQTYGTCEDTNKDHTCDYGCTDAFFGVHEDTNLDHKCEYGCAVAIGVHADADKNHACDYGCAETIGTCEDADKDHACDHGCGQTYGDCKDTDYDHKCDYGCDKSYGVHADTEGDGDHLCNYCKAEMSEHVEGEVKIENDVPSTCTVKGSYDEVIYCTECGEELSRNHIERELVPTVAKIGSECYASLAEAVAAANDNDVIVMQLDDVLTERLTIKKNITLDLNGKTITADFNDDYGAIYVGTAGVLTVTGDGTVINEKDVVIANYGKVNIQGGTFISNASNDGEYDLNAALYNMYFSESIYGTATITGGTLSSEVWNSGVLTVDGGVLNGLDNSGKTTITAGTINGVIEAGDGSDAEGLEGHGTIAISGGQFESTIENAWCAAGYGPNLEPVEGYFGVHVHQYETKVTDPTCTADGYTTYTCTTCGDAYEANVVPMLGHNFETYVHVDAGFGVYEHDEALCANGCDEIDIKNLVENSQWVAMLNENDTVGYTTVQAALAAAQAGDTVKMMVDSNEKDTILVIFKGVTLDLNGYDLTAAGLAAFAGNRITDSTDSSKKANNTSRLYVPEGNLSLQLDNGDLPFWTGTYYAFLTPKTEGYQSLPVNNANNFRFDFRPNFGFTDGTSIKSTYLDVKGGEENGITMIVSMSWVNSKGQIASQRLTYSNDMFRDAYKSSTSLSLSVTGTANFGDITIQVIIASNTGVEYKGEPWVYNAANAAGNN